MQSNFPFSEKEILEKYWKETNELSGIKNLIPRILENLENYQNVIMNAGWTRHQQAELDDVTDLIKTIEEIK